MSYYSMAYMYETVMGLYDGPKWRNRVLHMSDNQIMAIFYDHLEREEKKKSEKKSGKPWEFDPNVRACCESTDEYVPQQLSFFD